MNLLLLQPSDLVSSDLDVVHSSTADRPLSLSVTIGGERLLHLRKVLKVQPGDRVRTGLLNGALGNATVMTIDRARAVLSVTLDQTPPPPLDVTLCLALPRPKFLGRVLQHATTFGVKTIHLFQSARVEKSYWSSTVMTDPSLHRHLSLGLEQGRDTGLPELTMLRKFSALAETVEETSASGRSVFVADGDAERPFPREPSGPSAVVIGPEGGLVQHEIGRLLEAGGVAVSLGDRPLRVETAVSACLSRLLP